METHTVSLLKKHEQYLTIFFFIKYDSMCLKKKLNFLVQILMSAPVHHVKTVGPVSMVSTVLPVNVLLDMLMTCVKLVSSNFIFFKL